MSDLGAMEFFILALIDRAGLKSLYSFQKHAALQPGGIRPALLRLEQQKLIQRAESSRRQRRDFSLTPEGRDLLREAWRNVSGTPATRKGCSGRYASRS